MSAKTRLVRGSLGAAFGLLLAASGCSAGADIYVQPTKTDRSQCGLAAGQDVCARAFDLGVAAGQQAKFVGFLESVTAFAGHAHEARDEVSRACESILDGLGAPRPAAATGANARDRARTACAAAEAAIAAEHERSSFTLTASLPVCTKAPPPACASVASPRTKCGASSVTLTMHDGASDRARLAGGVLQKNLALFLDVKSRIEAASELTSAVAASAGDGAAGGDGALAHACVTDAVALARDATDDISVAVELSARFSPLVDSRP
ncbi:MAG TPA: hypothetical protein VLT33_21040 [Labilithrix sp.]|nr:hypothetical protein [Labilithrix sp.]